ncbi:MAG: HesA/MoeB/ThiF family protein [Peptococcales bacterium]
MDKERYHRQLIIPEIGEKGQERLMNAKVLVVGVGGLGSPILFYLVAAGIGTIGLLDHDIIDLSNLQRQILHSTSRIGMSKVKSAQLLLQDLNPQVNLKTYEVLLEETNVEEIIQDYDVVVAAVDNIATRQLLNRACINKDIPLVEGGVFNWDGTVHTIIKGQGPCYNCLYPDVQNLSLVPGVIGPIVGIVGSWQAMEVIKILLGTGGLLTDRMLLIDGLSGTTTEIKVNMNDSCSICRNNK